MNGEEIITTPTHPFYVPKKGWTDAIQLRAGDRLQLLNGEYVIIEQVQHEILEAPVTVYNFEVEEFHTYYVSDSGILVHNKCSGSYEILFESGKNYVGNGSEVKIIILESGSKTDIHYWQHDMNKYYKKRYGSFPPLNSKGW